MKAHRMPRRNRYPKGWFWLLALGVLATVSYWAYNGAGDPNNLAATPQPIQTKALAGDVVTVEAVQVYTPQEADALVRQNYGAGASPVTTSITKIIFRYKSQLPNDQDITIYGRAYLPGSPGKKLPIFAFAPGTTGIGDICAPSLENLSKANWGNYDSHMAAYAAQGYAGVTTDYEGMRDAARIHHYMIGELEGRAMLDSIRALQHLSQTEGRLDTSQIFVGGYSQGGHAAFWADKISSTYTPNIKIGGVIGWGPVMDVKETLADVIRAANINWFGPYLVYSYGDYYQDKYPGVLLPNWEQSLNTDVPANCINSDLEHWGHVPAAVYTPEFLQVLTTGQWEDTPYARFGRQLDENAVGPTTTDSQKRINQGANDNVVLPLQAQTVFPILCQSSGGAVQLAMYPGVTHYDAMVRSFADTLGWMKAIRDGQPQPSNCPAG